MNWFGGLVVCGDTGALTGNLGGMKIRVLRVLPFFEFDWLRVETGGRVEFVPGIGVCHFLGCVTP
jgi:hypothetical protein